MLGHRLLRSWAGRHDLGASFRRGASDYEDQSSTGATCFFHVDARHLDDVAAVLARFRPEVVVNAIGIVKQRVAAKDEIPSIEVNALFPHRLAGLCAIGGAKLVHISTDCVFSGTEGMYGEHDDPNPLELYGRTKLLGEVAYGHCLTLRASIIGLELGHKAGLVEWYLSQRGPVKGYRRAIFSGITTREMARAIEALLVDAPDLSGVWHLASERISKYEVLRLLTERLGRRDIELQPDDAFCCDRSLDSSALQARVEYRVPPWEAMLDELARDIQERNGR